MDEQVISGKLCGPLERELGTLRSQISSDAETRRILEAQNIEFLGVSEKL